MSPLATAGVARGAPSPVPVGVPAAAGTAGDATPVFAFAFVLLVAAVHLFAARWLLRTLPRSPVLSVAGGVSVAYVFVHMLPELSRATETFRLRTGALVAVERHVFLVALLGFVAYYGLERFATRTGEAADHEVPPSGVFWIHVGAFALYNALIGYLFFHPEASGVGGLVPFAVAMALHLVVTDYGLRDHHAERYHRTGRWVLAGAVLTGAVLGVVFAFDRTTVDALFAFLAGGVVLNVIKEELPEERESRFWAFALGTVGYALLLLAL